MYLQHIIDGVQKDCSLLCPSPSLVMKLRHTFRTQCPLASSRSDAHRQSPPPFRHLYQLPPPFRLPICQADSCPIQYFRQKKHMMTSSRSHSNCLDKDQAHSLQVRIAFKKRIHSLQRLVVVTMLQLWMGRSKDNDLVLIHPMARQRLTPEIHESLAGKPLLYSINPTIKPEQTFINRLPGELLSKCFKLLIRRSTNGNSAQKRPSPAQSISLTCSRFSDVVQRLLFLGFDLRIRDRGLHTRFRGSLYHVGSFEL